MKEKQKKRIKVFIASSVDEFKHERVELSEFILKMNVENFKSPDSLLEPVRCEDPHFKSMYPDGTQAMLNHEIPNCKYFYLLAGWDVGGYTEKEFNIAWNAYLEKHQPSIYIYLYRNETQEQKNSKRMTDFLERVQGELGYYTASCSSLNTIKLQMLLTFAHDGLLFGDIKIVDTDKGSAELRLNGVKILYANEIPVFGKDKELQDWKQKKEKLDARYSKWRIEKHAHPDDSYIKEIFDEIARDREKLENNIQQREQETLNIFHTISDAIHPDQPDQPITERTIKAIQYLYAGDRESALHELDDEERRHEVDCLKKNAIENKKGILANIGDLRLKIAVLKSEGITPGRRSQIKSYYQEAIDLAKTYKVGMDIYYEYSAFLCDQREYSLAIKIGKKLKQYYDFDEDHSVEYVALNDLLGVCHSRKQDFKGAIKYFQEAFESLRNLEDRPKGHDPAMSMVCRHWGDVLYTRNDWREAEVRYLEAYSNLQNLLDENPDEYGPRMAETCDSIAYMFEKTNRFDDAELYRKKSLDYCKSIQKRNLNDQNSQALRSKIYNNYGVALRDRAFYTLRDYNRLDATEKAKHLEEAKSFLLRAEYYLRNALDIRRDLAEENPEAYGRRVAKSCTNLAVVLKNISDFSKVECFIKKIDKVENHYNDAEVLLREALHIRRKEVSEKKAVYVSRTCVNLANVLMETDHPDEAESLYDEAYKLRKILTDKDRDSYEQYLASVCISYAEYEYNIKGNLSKSEQLFKEAEVILKNRKYTYRKNELKEIRRILKGKF